MKLHTSLCSRTSLLGAKTYSRGQAVYLVLGIIAVVGPLLLTILQDGQNSARLRKIYRSRRTRDHVEAYLSNVVSCQKTKAEVIASFPNCGALSGGGDRQIELRRDDDSIAAIKSLNGSSLFGNYEMRAFCGVPPNRDLYEIRLTPISGSGADTFPVINFDCR